MVDCARSIKKKKAIHGKYNHPILIKKMQILKEKGKFLKCTERGPTQAACRNIIKCF